MSVCRIVICYMYIVMECYGYLLTKQTQPFKQKTQHSPTFKNQKDMPENHRHSHDSQRSDQRWTNDFLTSLLGTAGQLCQFKVKERWENGWFDPWVGIPRNPSKSEKNIDFPQSDGSPKMYMFGFLNMESFWVNFPRWVSILYKFQGGINYHVRVNSKKLGPKSP